MSHVSSSSISQQQLSQARKDLLWALASTGVFIAGVVMVWPTFAKSDDDRLSIGLMLLLLAGSGALISSSGSAPCDCGGAPAV